MKPWLTDKKELIDSEILTADHRLAISTLFQNHPQVQIIQATGTSWAERDNTLVGWHLYKAG